MAAAAACGSILFLSAAATAQDANVAVLLHNLNGPLGLAVRPGGSAGSFELYYSERGRVSKIVSTEPEKPIAVINASEPPAPDGERPASLLFLSPDRLVVGYDGGNHPSSLRNYELSGKDSLPIAANQPQQQIELGDKQTQAGTVAGQYPISLTRTTPNDRVPNAVVAVAQPPAQCWKILVRAGTLDGAAAFLPLRPAPGPACAATSGQGFIIVSQGIGPETWLTFYHPIDATQVMQRSVKLQNVRGLAYSPRTGNLYAAAYGPDSPEELAKDRGIFRIDDAPLGQPCPAVQIAAVPRPTALAFTPDGALYVTAAGRGENRSLTGGMLVKVNGDL
jgi:hypothetical protein